MENSLKASHETIRDIIQAVGLLKFNFKGDFEPVNNLTPEQSILIDTLLNYGTEISKSCGYNKLADEMKKSKMGKPISEKFNQLEKEYRDKNKPSIQETLRADAAKMKAQNENDYSAPKRNQERKNQQEER